MSDSNPSRIIAKSKAWHKHGKHAKIDPVIVRNERKRKAPKLPYSSVREAVRKEKSK